MSEGVVCTFSVTQRTYCQQFWYNCETCWPNQSGAGCCQACAAICHKDHEIKLRYTARFFCDCGAEKTKCSLIGKSIPALEILPDISNLGFCEYIFKVTTLDEIEACFVKHKETVFTCRKRSIQETEILGNSAVPVFFATIFIPWREKGKSQPLLDDLYALKPTSTCKSSECEPEGYVYVFDEAKEKFVSTGLSVGEYEEERIKRK